MIREQLILNRTATTAMSIEDYCFNASQRQIFEEIVGLLDSNINTPKIVFVDGPGGTGKTYLFNSLLNHVRSDEANGGICLAVASSGTAALLLKGGTTAHSRFNIPLEVDSNTTCGISPRSDLGDLIRMTKLIVWDEASMISKDIFEAIDRTFRDVCKLDNPALEDVPFGGKIVVFGGDLRQVLPVINKASRTDIVNQCINRSPLWRHVVKLQLQVNMRVLQATGTEAAILDSFSKYLLRIGNGSEPTIEGTEFDIALDNNMLISNKNPINTFLNTVYQDFQGQSFDQDREAFLTSKAILTPKNTDVNTINDYLINKFPGEVVSIYSADKLDTQDKDEQVQYPVEYLNSINVGGLPPHDLKLKKGCPIMLLRNINPSKGLCNGTRLICVDIQTRTIVTRIVTGKLLNFFSEVTNSWF